MRSDRVTVTRRGSGAHASRRTGERWFGMPRVGFLSNKYAPSEGCVGASLNRGCPLPDPAPP